MKKQFQYTIVILGVLLGLVSCDPKDMPTEGITLPPMEFIFKVYPDTSHIKVGDTFTLYAAISSILDKDGIKLTDGYGELWFGMTKSINIPRVEIEDQTVPLNNVDYQVLIVNGNLKWSNSNSNLLHSLLASPNGDSIIMHYKFVFLKEGLYKIGGFQSSFYQGSEGKARWFAKFNVKDPNWNFIQIPGNPSPTLNDPIYYKHYNIVVNN